MNLTPFFLLFVSFASAKGEKLRTKTSILDVVLSRARRNAIGNPSTIFIPVVKRLGKLKFPVYVRLGGSLKSVRSKKKAVQKQIEELSEAIEEKLKEPAEDESNTDIDECNSGPCKNGGTCTNSDGSYSCKCQDGWTGINCNQDKNECNGDPCKNGGACTNSDGSYSCSCQDGWTGNNCNQDINECDSGPCKNGGTCTNSDGSYSCSCQDGWKGNNCNQVTTPPTEEPSTDEIKEIQEEEKEDVAGAEFDLRLVDENGSVATTSGWIQVFLKGKWGTICDDGWLESRDSKGDKARKKAGDVFCRQLGYVKGGMVFHNMFFKGKNILSDAPVFLNNLACEGTENGIAECKHRIHTGNCSHKEDLWLDCESRKR